MAIQGSTPWIGATAGRWGHWGASWLIGCVLAVIAIGVHPLPPGTPLAVLGPLAILGVAVAGWLAMRQHDRSLCEVCVRSMPLNTSEVAARHRNKFALVHATANRTLVFSYLVVLLGSNLAVHNHQLVIRLGWALIQSTMIYLVLAYSSHRRFQPWCPQCQGGDGGDDDHAHAPDPMPHGSQSR